MAFATILAVVAGLTITAAASFAHDIYANVIQKGRKDAAGEPVAADPNGEVRVARRTVVVIGILAILGASERRAEHRIPRRSRFRRRRFRQSADHSLFALLRRFTTRGAVWSMYGGLGSAILLIVLSPVFSEPED